MLAVRAELDVPDDDGAVAAEEAPAEEETLTTAAPEVPPEGSDQVEMPFKYDHGRMPFFMKAIWIGFLAFGTWYVVVNLLEALSTEIGG